MSTAHVIPARHRELDFVGHFMSAHDIALPGGRRHYVGGWDATGTGRLEYGGAMVAGPHAYAGPQARVLAAHRQVERRVVTVNPGDTITIAGCTFRVERDTRARYLRGDSEITLTPIGA